MRRAAFTAEARREFLLELAYYEREHAGLGARFAEAVETAVARALAFPASGAAASSGCRTLILRHFSFSIAYLPDEEGVTIVAVLHHARAPGYWQDRVQDRAA